MARAQEMLKPHLVDYTESWPTCELMCEQGKNSLASRRVWNSKGSGKRHNSDGMEVDAGQAKGFGNKRAGRKGASKKGQQADYMKGGERDGQPVCSDESMEKDGQAAHSTAKDKPHVKY